MINTFDAVAIQDPFSHEVAPKQMTGEDTPKNMHDIGGNGKSCAIPKKIDDLVYAKTRYIPNFAPFCIYIPKTELMFKMMRACIGIKDPKDLWFNQE